MFNPDVEILYQGYFGLTTAFTSDVLIDSPLYLRPSFAWPPSYHHITSAFLRDLRSDGPLLSWNDFPFKVWRVFTINIIDLLFIYFIFKTYIKFYWLGLTLKVTYYTLSICWWDIFLQTVSHVQDLYNLFS